MGQQYNLGYVGHTDTAVDNELTEEPAVQLLMGLSSMMNFM